MEIAKIKMILASYRLSLLVFINSLVRRVGELGVRAQFRDNKVAAKVEKSLSWTLNRNPQLETTVGGRQRTY